MPNSNFKCSVHKWKTSNIKYIQGIQISIDSANRPMQPQINFGIVTHPQFHNFSEFKLIFKHYEWDPINMQPPELLNSNF